MKKYLYYAFVCLVTISACNQSKDITPTDNFLNEITELKTMHKDGLYLAMSAFKKNATTSSSNDLVLNEKEMINDILTNLKGAHFIASDEFIDSFSNNYSSKKIFGDNDTNELQAIHDAGINQLYNESQMLLVQPFLDKLITTNDFIKVKKIASDFQNKVILSQLVREEKIQLLSLSTSVEALSEFIAEGGDDAIRQRLSQMKETNPSARVDAAGCSVNWRSVWAGAVVGFVSGAVGGCYAGATAGTVAVPIVGTVTGCVSAGVASGAVGFAGGVASGIASELLTSCFR